LDNQVHCCNVQVDKERVKVWFSLEATPDFDNLKEWSRVFVHRNHVATALKMAKAWVVEEIPTERHAT
jgi:hypothetical protein